jgi:hypothetical protein
MKKENNIKGIVLATKILVGCAVAFFIFSRIWFLVRGPSLSIIKPENGSVLPVGITLLQGKAATATNVWISGISVPVDTEGMFTYDIYVARGLTKIPVVVKNRYGTSSTKELVVWGE